MLAGKVQSGNLTRNEPENTFNNTTINRFLTGERGGGPKYPPMLWLVKRSCYNAARKAENVF